MKKNSILIAVLAFCLAAVSCKKESTNPTSSDITGTWNFVNLQATTYQSSEYTFGGDVIKSVTTSNYTTINNSGTMTIEAAQMKGNNLSYGVNSRGYTTMYENGVVTDTSSIPMINSFSAFSSTAAYTRVNADSIYFPQGATIFGGVQGASQPGGARIQLQGNTLKMIQSAAQVTNNNGQVIVINVSSIATLSR